MGSRRLGNEFFCEFTLCGDSLTRCIPRHRMPNLADSQLTSGGRVAVFTHGGVINQILVHATRSRPFAFIGADNASVSHLVVIGDRWVVRRFNDTAHLDPVFTVRPAPPSA
jgi:probable phosphoglycerate mutase